MKNFHLNKFEIKIRVTKNVKMHYKRKLNGTSMETKKTSMEMSV